MQPEDLLHNTSLLCIFKKKTDVKWSLILIIGRSEDISCTFGNVQSEREARNWRIIARGSDCSTRSDSSSEFHPPDFIFGEAVSAEYSIFKLTSLFPNTTHSQVKQVQPSRGFGKSEMDKTSQD